MKRILVHSHLEPKHTGTQLFSKNTGTLLFREKYIGTQLFRAKIYWGTAIMRQHILGHSYLMAKHTGTQLFRDKTYWCTAIY